MKQKEKDIMVKLTKFGFWKSREFRLNMHTYFNKYLVYSKVQYNHEITFTS